MSETTDTPGPRPHRTRWQRPGVYLIYLLFYPFPWLYHPPSMRDVVGSLLALPVFLWLYFVGMRKRDWRTLPYSLGVYALSFALQPLHGVWGNVAIYGVTMTASTARREIALTGVVLFNVLLAGFGLWRGLPFAEWGTAMFFGTVVAGSTFAFMLLQHKNAELEATRESARRLAISAERERISRDLHDLLGHTLTTVAVKADLARRLIDHDVDQARREIEDIHRTARAALADVRGAVTGMRSTSLAVEVAESRLALASAGVAFDYQGPQQPLPGEVETALAFVLREATTNIVRHAQAEHCHVHIASEAGGALQMTVSDDGRARGAVREGNGLRGLRERIAAIGGTLALESQGGMLLRVLVPAARSGT